MRYLPVLAIVATALVATAADAKAPPKAAASTKTAKWVSPHQAGGLPLKTRPVGDKAVIHTMADMLGLVRNAGPVESTELVNRLQWNGAGTANGQKVDYSYALSLHLAAAREDIRPKAGGVRKVSVVFNDKAWNETSPGVGQTWANAEAASRALQLARTPFGFAKAAMKDSAVKVEDPGPSGPVKVSLVINGTPTVAELDPDYRPRHITMTVGGHTIEDVYTDYTDLAEYGLMFPNHIVEKTDGRVTLDIHLTDARVASYLVFPPPAN